jgi:hypothetical protein
MKKLLLVLCLFIIHTTHAQQVPVELMAGQSYLNYLHNSQKQIDGTGKWGWTHIANLMFRYQTNPENGGKTHEIMNQVYLTRRLGASWTLQAGLFYSAATQMKQSVALQYRRRSGVWSVVLTPRYDWGREQSFELFGLLEVKPRLTGRIQLYTRLQFMTNHGAAGHNRSYEQLRLGWQVNHVQQGIGLTIDQYGRSAASRYNYGIFVRKLL